MLTPLLKIFIAEGEDPKTLRLWRMWVGVGLIGLWLFFWWALGAVPVFGGDFAKAADVRDTERPCQGCGRQR